MKLDEHTLTVLKNFQGINQSIRIDAGNVITTSSPSKTFLGRAKLEVQFPKTFAIYNVKTFLSIALMFKDAEIEFHDNYLNFVDGKKKIRFTFCDISTIVYPERPLSRFPEDEVFLEFTLTSDMLKEVHTVISVLGHDGIILKGEKGKLLLTTSSDSNQSEFVREIGETDRTFGFIFESTKLNFIPQDYKVSLAKKLKMHLESDTIEYWVAGHAKSKFSE